MMNRKKMICLILLAMWGVLILPADNNAEDAIIFEEFVEPTILGSLFLDLNGHASIDLAVLVNEEGYVDDWLAIRTNDVLIVKSVRRVIDEWKFKPSINANGQPSWAYYEFKIEFKKSGQVVTITPREATLTLFNLLKDDIYLVVPFQELDSIPTPIDIKTPTIHSSLRGKNAGKSIRMEFFIDKDGTVRMPVVVESDVEDKVAAILMESLMDWKFDPPKKNGRKVATRAIAPFSIQ